MRTRASHILGLAMGAILLPAFLSPQAQGQNILLNQPIGETEALTGNWSMAQNDANNYTYYYAVNHSSDNETPVLPPEIVYAVSFDASPVVPGESQPSPENGYAPVQVSGFQESSWVPIDFQGDRARLVSEVETGLRGILGQPEAQDFYAGYQYSLIPHISLSAYMDSAVPEPPTGSLLTVAALALLAFLKAKNHLDHGRMMAPATASRR